MLELHYARRARRRRIDLPCEVISPVWDEPVKHQLVDISPYGVWLKTSFPRPIGERVVLSFASPHGKELTVFAEVTRSVKRRPGGERHSGMGLEFVDISRGDRIALHRALRALPQDKRRHLAMFRFARSS